MRITQLDSHLLRLPLIRPMALPADKDRGNWSDHVFLLLIQLDTDAGHRALGFAYSYQGGGRALKAVVEDDLSPLLAGEDPLDHERLGAKVYWALQGIGRRGLVPQAYSAVDLALWDLKGKVAGLPLYKLLGGARESTPVYGTDTGWLWMSPEEIVEASRPYLDKGMMGIKVRVGGSDPETDADRVTRIREALGEDVWLGVDANQRYDYATALSMGHFFEEEMGIDWFEEPISCEDVEGHARLAERLEVPIAVGETLFGPDEFAAYLARGAADILQPDVTRLGGLTSLLKVAALAEQHHRPVAPHLLPEIGVHLACGLPQVRAVEYVPWLFPAFVEPPAIVDGRLTPSHRPGLGLDVRTDVLEKYRVKV
jgi:L-alanine-DL-glutamate epimerase-like enolase superfamily enzyme